MPFVTLTTGLPRRPFLLVVDDDSVVVGFAEQLAVTLGFDVAICASGSEALQIWAQRPIEVVLVDLRMPDVNGLELLGQIRRLAPSCEVILMHTHAGPQGLVDAIRLGARDYLTKPFDLERLEQVLAEVADDLKRRAHVVALESDVADHVGFHGMVGRSSAMQETFRLIQRLAPHADVVLLAGETGTGKELAAKALHQAGPHRDRPFLTVNCSAAGDAWFETATFGRLRDAFAAAADGRPHMRDVAAEGTIFFDEVAELPMSAQAKLLRALEGGQRSTTGVGRPAKADVTVVAATHRDLRAEVAAGRFRGDLLQRLNTIEVKLPPLRDRREDIPYLTAVFLRDDTVRLRKPLLGLTSGAERALMAARWDGNVRELKTVVARACMLADGVVISEREVTGALVPDVQPPLARPRTVEPAQKRGAQPRATLHDLEREHILDVLRQVSGNRMAAAKLLGISRRALYRRLDRHHISGVVPKGSVPRPGVGELSAHHHS